jgi:hypothetical protein
LWLCGKLSYTILLQSHFANLKNRLFILFFAYFFFSCFFIEAQEKKNATEEEQTEEWEEVSEEEYEEYEEAPRILTAKEVTRREKETDKLARKILKDRFKEIDRQRKIVEREEKRAEKGDKIKRRQAVSLHSDEEKSSKKESKKRIKNQEEEQEDEDENDLTKESVNPEEWEEYYDDEEFESNIDSELLMQRMNEIGSEMQNERDIRDAARGKGKNGVHLLKLKIPACRYLNEVIYKRNDFEFIYQFDFFIYYFKHRYHHPKRFYDMEDSTRVIAKQVMELVGNTIYRKTDFNQIIDSIGFLLGRSVEEYLDLVISDLNLEYLATGEIKFHYKNKNQRRIYARVKPSDIENRSLGDITFYTRNKKKIIERIDASPYNSLLPLPEKDYTDSLLNLKINLLNDTSLLPGQNLKIINLPKDTLQAPRADDRLSPASNGVTIPLPNSDSSGETPGADNPVIMPVDAGETSKREDIIPPPAKEMPPAPDELPLSESIDKKTEENTNEKDVSLPNKDTE